MKILLVAYLHGAGGAEKQIILLANHLSLNNEVFLGIFAENNCKYDILDSVKTIDLSKNEKKLFRIFQRRKRLDRLYRSIKPDLSIHFWFQSVYLSFFTSKKIRGLLIYSERGDPSDSEYGGLLGIVRKKSLRIIDGLVFQTKEAKNSFIKNSIKSVIIENPVYINETKYPLPCKKRKKTIINVGRLHDQKNQQLLIDAFCLCQKEIPDFSLEIYGDGDLKESLENQIISKGLTNRVFLKPSTKDILDIVYKSSLFILSSKYEGMPNALLEAMSLGVPSISTDYSPGGVESLISNYENGIIVPSNNILALSTAIKELLLDKESYDKIANNAIKTRYKYDPELIFKKWDAFILSLKTEKKNDFKKN